VLDDVVQDKARCHPRQALFINNHNRSVTQEQFTFIDYI